MAGIYLHIPFCRQACTYCNFHFTTSLRGKDDMITAMRQEIQMEAAYVKNETIHTIYFGGGTPSLLTDAECRVLLQELQKNYEVSPDAEVTLEANPDDITEDRLRAWKELGINRLSIGVQSFFEEELQWMNRAHHAGQATDSLKKALSFFDNITMDLIYGSPLLTDEMWKENVQCAIDLGIPHLSCYALTVEEKTPLHKMISSRRSVPVDADKQARQFLQLMQWLRSNGYEHYEVSNFAKPGFRSRHNSSYWKGETYLGIGPSAHSYNGVERRWNIANNSVYVREMNSHDPQREKEMLTPVQSLNEYIMISLRTLEGMDMEKITRQWGTDQHQRIAPLVENKLKQGLMRISGNNLVLTDDGMLMADGIASDLFV